VRSGRQFRSPIVVVTEYHADDGAWLHDPAGIGPRLLLQVPEPKTAENRLHMDIRVAGTGSAGKRCATITQAADR
jgi:hypothetical protein